MKAILIDDEQHALDNLVYELDKCCPGVEILEKCTSAKEGLLAIKSFDPDVVFLDIQMPFMNGFELLEVIHHISFEVIFVTAYDEFAIAAFEKNALDFITKPITGKKLSQSISRLLVRLAEKEIIANDTSNLATGISHKILLSTSEAYHFVETQEIIYLHAQGSYTNVILQDNKRLLISKSIKQLQNKLPKNVFFRCHNSYVINLNYIQSFVKNEGGKIVMSNNDELKISRSRKDELIKIFQ